MSWATTLLFVLQGRHHRTGPPSKIWRRSEHYSECYRRNKDDTARKRATFKVTSDRKLVSDERGSQNCFCFRNRLTTCRDIAWSITAGMRLMRLSAVKTRLTTQLVCFIIVGCQNKKGHNSSSFGPINVIFRWHGRVREDFIFSKNCGDCSPERCIYRFSIHHSSANDYSEKQSAPSWRGPLDAWCVKFSAQSHIWRSSYRKLFIFADLRVTPDWATMRV